MAFELRKPKLELLQNSDEKSLVKVKEISVEDLVHYKDHPFKLYSGQRLKDLVESIKENGIYNPLLVRPIFEEKYEVLSGHNRLEAAKVIPISVVPCIVKDVSDEEAEIILIESNLMQRSFSELLLSEKAYVIAAYYNSLKSQGKRNDLIKGLNNYINDSVTSEQLAPKSSYEEASEKYELSKDDIKRFVRLNMLSDDLKLLLDNGQLKKGTGTLISFLTQEQMKETYDYIAFQNITPNISEAEKLKEISKLGKWEEGVNGTLHTVFWQEDKQIKKVVLKYEKIKEYFKNGQTEKEIEEELLKALKFYRSKDGGASEN